MIGTLRIPSKKIFFVRQCRGKLKVTVCTKAFITLIPNLTPDCMIFSRLVALIVTSTPFHDCQTMDLIQKKFSVRQRRC